MIAILGATGYVGRSLAREFAAHDPRSLTLFARAPSQLTCEHWPRQVAFEPLGSFDADRFDLVINAIGAGDPTRVRELGASILDITELWDRRVLETKRPDTRYVFLSSGAVYGTAFEIPVDADSTLSIAVNALEQVPAYVLAKLVAEFRHRQFPRHPILDLRVFAYADPSISDSSRFFLADLARSVRHRTPFRTNPADIVRDYAGAEEVHALIAAWEAHGAPHGPADVFSQMPVSKLALLDDVRRRFSIDIRWDADVAPGQTGTRSVYASQFRAAAAFGYAPIRTSRDIVLATLEAVAATGQESPPGQG